MNPQLQELIKKETQRQQNTLGLIPSENFSSKAVREAVGSVFMHKYSEGYPAARYYEGNDVIDDLENLAKQLVTQTMLKHETEKVKAQWHVNVQVLSGSVANLAVYNAVLKPGDTILAMYLPDGGHLSHGWSYTPTTERDSKVEDSKGLEALIYRGGSQKLNIVSKFYNVIGYKVDPDSLTLDYDSIEKIAEAVKPKMIITGGTAYPRNIDYGRMRQIADSVEAYYLADVAHEAGLIAGGASPSPFQFADFVTFTTHKTLRGPKGAVAMCRTDYAKQLDKSVIPGLLGGPFNHTIAGIVQALTEASTDKFSEYAKQIVRNAQVMADAFIQKEYAVVSGGTDKHLVLIDLRNKKIGGKYFARALSMAGIVTNKNTVPYEPASPINPSGIRLGTPIVTTRGMKEEQMQQIVDLIDSVYKVALPLAEKPFETFEKKLEQDPEIVRVRLEVEKLCQEFPLP